MEKNSRNNLRQMRKKRGSIKNRGTAQRPRLSVFRSLKNIWVQVINDEKGVTLFSTNLKVIKGKNDLKSARLLGKLVAEKCLEKNIKAVVFDRSGYKYHGKIKELAEGAREGKLTL